MQINNFFDLFIYTIFTLSVIFIGIPSSIYLLIKAIKGITLYGWGKFSNGFIDSDWGKSPLELIFIGLFGLAFSFWYLLIDKNGHLFLWIDEMKNICLKRNFF